MELDRRTCDRARRSRDPRFDGRFFIAVTSTGIYCRPVCPARSPKDENIRYYPTAAAAQAAGFRPCLRCRPEASPGTPAWLGTSNVVSRGLRLISEGALDEDGVEKLADRLGVTDRHLRRLFLQHLGATPLEVAITRRVHFAKKLLDETSLSCAAIAEASGFGSLRRFNGEIRRAYSRTPTELRKLSKPGSLTRDSYRFRLSYRPPYDWKHALSFLATRATPGVEVVSGDSYRRTIAIGDSHGSLTVSPSQHPRSLDLEVRFPEPKALLSIVERVRRIFDLGADPHVIAEHLGADPHLRAALRRHPGIRTPGAWDGFELAVRAIVGQQISVKAATTMMGRIASRFGTTFDAGEGLCVIFPDVERLKSAAIEGVGIIPARAEAIRELARRVADGSISFSTFADTDRFIALMKAIPGVGEWTAQYVAMRALNEPDAFPSGDLVLRRMLGDCSAREVDRKSLAWRPWRAYAVMLLWESANEQRPERTRKSQRRVHPVRAAVGREAVL